MSASNGHAEADAAAALTAARPVVLLRYRPGVVGETARTVHVVPLPSQEQTGPVNALCGARLMLSDLETVAPGQGMPCTTCLLTTTARQPPAHNPDSPNDSDAMVLCYRQWGWPVSRHHDQLQLSLYREVSALAIPLLLGIKVTEILTARGCAPAVLAHPFAPEHSVVLTTERYGVPLPWPREVHRITGFLQLPPTMTPCGPITWTQPPQQDSLRLCREIDLFAAIHTALRDCSRPSSDLP